MTTFSDSPYYDDYSPTPTDPNKDFVRVLFRPGYSVQSRELNQLQSILQTQISRFGDHVFKNGSRVYGGGLSIAKTHFIRIEIPSDMNITPSYFEGKVILSVDGTVRATVMTVRPEISELCIVYQTNKHFSLSDTIIVTDTENVLATVSDTEGSVGECMLAYVNEGVFYVNGYFVYTDKQTAFMGYTHEVSCILGFNVDDRIITESDDSTLLDPANNTYNFNAPGAHRYIVSFELGRSEYSKADIVPENFIQVAKVLDGEFETNEPNPRYNELEHELARRTYDESGSYTVKAFRLSFSDFERFEGDELSDNEEYVGAVLSPGKAYVKGYEFETISNTVLPIRKSRDTETSINTSSFAVIGNYFAIRDTNGSTTGLPNFGTMPVFTVRTDSDRTIGKCRVKSLTTVSGIVRAYVTDVSIDTGTLQDGEVISALVRANDDGIVFLNMYTNMQAS